MARVNLSLRRAALEDRSRLEALIAESATGLSRNDYSAEQVEGALQGAFGVDSELIRDGTYFVAEVDGAIVGCGGWSRRKTLFGGDAQASRQSDLLDPVRDSARIRAFFVHPTWARRGIGRAILERCEAEAREQGFRSAELLATLPGERFYRALGYTGEDRIEHRLAEDLTIDFVPMRKDLA
ncbi:MAG: GNAT family N-acetyltransferase [Acidobacteriota bacterium]|nr:GNAT family N-acetyltransferase [Acidobacteriota bacterium]MDQ5872647.1 GNAT family N-acetyltransferase [Acidobacteriota bacterium]